jgi:hypothetical protein
VIAGKDGPINEEAKSALSRLQSLARLSNIDDYKSVVFKTCNHCGKNETLGGTKLMKCQRCKLFYYCNKVCQVADWKKHKRACATINSGIVSRSTVKATHSTILAFIKSNCFDIAKEVYKKSQEYNVPKKKLFLEIDFYGDAPALRNEFKVWLTSEFLEGSSVADAPDWFRHFDEKFMARLLREAYAQVRSDDLITVCRAGDGAASIQAIYYLVNERYHFLSDEVVESIGKEDYVRMIACLGQHTTDAYFREKKSGVA